MSNRMHKIYHQVHGFANPPVNPKCVVDASYCISARGAGLDPAASVTSLVGATEFHLTQCMITQIVNSVGRRFIPPDVHVDMCLHPVTDVFDPVRCMVSSQLSSENPQQYLLATTENTDLPVHGLPVIILDGGRPVYKKPADYQMGYASHTPTHRVLADRQEDERLLEERVARFQR